MSIDCGFSFSVGKILESSNVSSLEQYSPYRSAVETTSKLNFMSNVKRKNNSGASNKTRKRSSQTRTVKTTTLTDDGYGWRKYGQKKINNDPHPKSYYRCTHHSEEQCEAKKWVQQESDDPPVYKTTYLGNHTCQNPLKIPQILLPYTTSSSGYSASSSDGFISGSFDLDDSSSVSKPVFLCFDSPTSNNSYNIMGFASSSSSSSSSSLHQPADFMMFSDDSVITQCCINMEESIQEDPDEIGAYENGTITEEYLCNFPPMGSPSCNFDSYDFNLMMGEYSQDLDSFMNYMDY